MAQAIGKVKNKTMNYSYNGKTFTTQTFQYVKVAYVEEPVGIISEVETILNPEDFIRPVAVSF